MQKTERSDNVYWSNFLMALFLPETPECAKRVVFVKAVLRL